MELARRATLNERQTIRSAVNNLPSWVSAHTSLVFIGQSKYLFDNNIFCPPCLHTYVVDQLGLCRHDLWTTVMEVTLA